MSDHPGTADTPCGEQTSQAVEATAALATELALALEIIEALTDEDPCRLDHNGNCQAHMAFGEGECPHAMAKVWISRYADKFADGSEANP